MNFHIGKASSVRIFSSHSSPQSNGPDQPQVANTGGSLPAGNGSDNPEPSFFKKHYLLAAYIAFAVILCASLAAVATVALHGLPAVFGGL